jgi:hypothetical protein
MDPTKKRLLKFAMMHSMNVKMLMHSMNVKMLMHSMNVKMMQQKNSQVLHAAAGNP